MDKYPQINAEPLHSHIWVGLWILTLNIFKLSSFFPLKLPFGRSNLPENSLNLQLAAEGIHFSRLLFKQNLLCISVSLKCPASWDSTRSLVMKTCKIPRVSWRKHVSMELMLHVLEGNWLALGQRNGTTQTIKHHGSRGLTYRSPCSWPEYATIPKCHHSPSKPYQSRCPSWIQSLGVEHHEGHSPVSLSHHHPMPSTSFLSSITHIGEKLGVTPWFQTSHNHMISYVCFCIVQNTILLNNTCLVALAYVYNLQ